MSAAAMATFSDSTGGRIGIVTVSLAAARASPEMPAPSPPRTIAVGPRRSTRGSGAPPRGTAAIRRTRASRAAAITSCSVPRAATGTRKVPPIAPRSAFHPKGLADPSIVTMPLAPQAAAVRTIAPTLPGSWRPARTSTSCRAPAKAARRSGGCVCAMATTPDGC